MPKKKLINERKWLNALALFTMARQHQRECEKYVAGLRKELAIDEWTGLEDQIYEDNGTFEKGMEAAGFAKRPAKAK